MNYNKLSKQELIYILSEKIKISSSNDVIKYIRNNVNITPSVEQFGIILLSTSNSIIKHSVLFKGGINKALIDQVVIFRTALKTQRCSSIILFHNHPSGNSEPSNEDINITKKIKECGELIGINVIDHIIFTETSEESFSSLGYL